MLVTLEEIICDNGTQLTTIEYKEFAYKWGFTITKSSPRYPRGQWLHWEASPDHQKALQKILMRMVPTTKWLFKSWGQLPLTVTHHPQQTSPWQRDENNSASYYQTKMKTTLPAIIKPPWNSVVRSSLQSRQDICRYDAQAKERSTLLPTQPVQVQDPISHRWSQGVVKSKAETPRS